MRRITIETGRYCRKQQATKNMFPPEIVRGELGGPFAPAINWDSHPFPGHRADVYSPSGMRTAARSRDRVGRMLSGSANERARWDDVTGVFCTSGSEREFTLEGSWYAD